MNEKDIYSSANLLIKQYDVEGALDHAYDRMRDLMSQQDVKGASVWLSISVAIRELGDEGARATLH